MVVAEAAWNTVEAVTSGGLAIVWSTVALLAAVALTSVYENVAAASAYCVTDVLIAGSATFVGSATFAARHSNFAVGNRVDTCCREFKESLCPKSKLKPGLSSLLADVPLTADFEEVVAASVAGCTAVLIVLGFKRCEWKMKSCDFYEEL
ncbi:hypothetical protein KY290_020580 [Solanum tuberosum]|uniref:CASP-like protein n=1 Tax=Solanum tuberosum TaxID=4113 RepID=A0ABQ7V150_SOLTU|nr:hypothetical protein KY290_020580 [Solanum tuberosum]